MHFAFSEVCTLLSRVENIELHDPPIFPAAEKAAQTRVVIESWFKSHRRTINQLDQSNTVALLSALLPERRTDRVYGIQCSSLCRVLCRCLGLRSTRAKELEAYKQPGKGDLAVCLERVLKDDGPPARPPVTLSDVDEMLDILAGNCRFSDVARRLPSGSSKARDDVLGNVFKRLDASQSKWLTRLVLKDFSPVRLDDTVVLQSFHFLLPDLLRFQNDLTAAIRLLRGPLKEYPENPDPRSRRLHRQGAAALLKPAVGVKVGRPNFYKARSIDNCISICGSDRWVLERKYDGEYCEVHVDLSRSHKPSECITIFSKSGKNSTEDRRRLHQTLVDCLQLGEAHCKIRRQAILLGELVVYSDKEHRILPFETIRKYVSRSGVFLGTDEDSLPHAYEHLAIVFFDLLLLDNEIVMRRPLEERRTWLREVYSKIGGRAMGAEWKIVDFNDPERAKNVLIQQFAAALAERCEGLILKPSLMPYFNLDPTGNDHINGYIKLKADYIAGMGDEADFAVVGGSYNGQQALKSGITNLRWTDFHLGCLLNKPDVLRFDARPRFKIVGTIQAEHCIPKPILQAVNVAGQFCANLYSPIQPPAKFDVECTDSFRMNAIFSDPFVFEMLGSGFEKPSNCNFFMLRHPRVTKLHQDRTWKDCISLQELQEQASAARAAPWDSESQETKRLISKLEMKCRKKSERQGASTPRSGTKTSPSGAGQRSPSESTMQQASNARIVVPRTTEQTLNGTTLISSSSSGSKRPREGSGETPCPSPKRQQIDTGEHRTGKLGQSPIESQVSIPKSSPLADITNTAPLPPASPTTATGLPSSPILPNRSHKAPNIQRYANKQISFKTTDIPLSDSSFNHCTSHTCPFFSAVVYPTPCIAQTPYIISDLLHTRHPTTITIPTLAHWDRDSLSPSHPPLSEIVGESQAYAGMRKIVLVEGRRVGTVREVVGEVVGLNQGKWRERVEVWDWRVLEGCEKDGLEEWFLGETKFESGRGGAVFVENLIDVAG